MKPDLPRYRLNEPAYLQPARSSGPSKLEAVAELAFEGAPTFSMAPLNPPAVAAKAASIRSRGLGCLRNPPAGDRSILVTLTESIGGRRGTVDQMAAHIEQWLETQEATQ